MTVPHASGERARRHRVPMHGHGTTTLRMWLGRICACVAVRPRRTASQLTARCLTLLPASFWKNPPMALDANQLPDAVSSVLAASFSSSSSFAASASIAIRRAATRRASSDCVGAMVREGAGGGA